MATSNATKAGLFIFLGALQFAMAVLVSEILYSAYGTLRHAGQGNTTGYVYSVSVNAISDLGANCTGSVCTIPPSAYLFDVSVVILGVMLMAGAFYLNRAFHWMPAAVMFALAGVGAIGVGIFPETAGYVHHIFTLVAFLPAGLAGIVGARLAKKPFFYFSIILGLATLVAMFLYVGMEYAGLGQGGMERMVVYPAVFLALGFGGHLIGRDDWPKA